MTRRAASDRSAPDQAVELPRPTVDGGHTLERALHARRSVREYDDQAIATNHLGQLLWAAQGVTGPGGERTAPSAGGTYPLETWVAVGNVLGLAPGAYRYDPGRHALSLHRPGDRRKRLAAAALGQPWIENAGAVFLVAAVYDRTTARYGERGRRYVHMEVGHVAQNIALQATALRLGTVVVGAFDDAAVKMAMGLAEAEEPVCLVPVGPPAWASEHDD